MRQRHLRSDSRLHWLHTQVEFAGDECLTWPGPLGPRGRGKVEVDGHTVYPAVQMCLIVNGPKPSPIHEAAHLCGKGHEGCVNPRHLAWKTKVENAADRRVHGTMLLGEDHPLTKVNEGQVLALREFARIVSIAAAARLMNIPYYNAFDIVKRRTWRHI